MLVSGKDLPACFSLPDIRNSSQGYSPGRKRILDIPLYAYLVFGYARSRRGIIPMLTTDLPLSAAVVIVLSPFFHSPFFYAWREMDFGTAFAAWAQAGSDHSLFRTCHAYGHYSPYPWQAR